MLRNAENIALFHDNLDILKKYISPVNCELLQKYLFNNITCKELAKEYGISIARVQKIISDSLIKIKIMKSFNFCDMQITTRLHNTLIYNNINTVYDLSEYSIIDVLLFRFMSLKQLKELLFSLTNNSSNTEIIKFFKEDNCNKFILDNINNYQTSQSLVDEYYKILNKRINRKYTLAQYNKKFRKMECKYLK